MTVPPEENSERQDVRDIANPFDATSGRSVPWPSSKISQRAAKSDGPKIIVVIVAGLPLLPVVVPLERRVLHDSHRRKLLAAFPTRHSAAK